MNNRSSGIRNVYLAESLNYREEYDKKVVELNTANSRINKLTTDKTNLENQINNLNGQISTLTTQINNLNGQLTDMTTQRDTLQSQLNTANASITQLNTEITNLTNERNTFRDKYYSICDFHDMPNDIKLDVLTSGISGKRNIKIGDIVMFPHQQYGDIEFIVCGYQEDQDYTNLSDFVTLISRYPVFQSSWGQCSKPTLQYVWSDIYKKINTYYIGFDPIICNNAASVKRTYKYFTESGGNITDHTAATMLKCGLLNRINVFSDSNVNVAYDNYFYTHPENRIITDKNGNPITWLIADAASTDTIYAVDPVGDLMVVSPNLECGVVIFITFKLGLV